MQVESFYLHSPLSLARFTGRNFGRIAVDWRSREVTLTAHSQCGLPRMTKRMMLDDMGPGQVGECDSSSPRSAGLKAVSTLQSLFPELSNTQCIVMTVVLSFIVAPIVVVAVCTSYLFRPGRKSTKDTL